MPFTPLPCLFSPPPPFPTLPFSLYTPLPTSPSYCSPLPPHLFLFTLLCIQPQNCIPDVVIWMLSGNKRVAVKRIPSHEIMYSCNAKARGKKCGKLQVLFLTVSVLGGGLVGGTHYYHLSYSLLQ